MRAVKLVAPHTLALREAPTPALGPEDVLVEIAGAGLCHSDLHLLDSPRPPFLGGTIGHEGAGKVASMGSGVEGLRIGDPVLVNLVYSCGRCRACVEGRENACQVTGTRLRPPTTPGLGTDGAMAEYLAVNARHLDTIAGLDPVLAAPLADAGTTPMHAINSVRSRLTPGATVVVIGVGGLGHVGLQILKATSAVRVIAIDSDEAKRELAGRLGADLVLGSGPDTARRVLELTGGYGADVVLDFVAVQPTVDLAVDSIAPEGLLRFIGLGGGTFTYRSAADTGRLPWGVDIRRSYGGTRADQRQVIELARQGRIEMKVQTYPIEEFQRACDDLAAGRVLGRAVVVP